MSKYLVTGGAGFIGSNFVRRLLAGDATNVVVLDKLTYAGNRENLAEVENDRRLIFIEGDILDRACVDGILEQHQPRFLVNFAAESHVDRSIDGPGAFVDTNIVGTFRLLEASRKHLGSGSGDGGSGGDGDSSFRFLHVSTDEVFGSLGPEGSFSETTPYAPNSPYAASKAAADHLVRAYHHTYDLPVLVTNCSNNYGPYQFPEKLIPLTILNALEGKSLPIYGDGMNVRDWLHVDDHCDGILQVLQRGRLGESYNIGGNAEKPNIEIVDTICDLLEHHAPAAGNPKMAEAGVSSYGELKQFVTDRKGHDRRYAIDASRMGDEFGWRPRHDFASGMEATVRWYIEHRDWCESVQSESRYRRERLGLS